jgi:hypothetical protein
VVVLYDLSQERELKYWLDVTIDRNAADLAAAIRSPHVPAPAVEACTG